MKKLQHKNVISLVETFEDTEKQKLYPQYAKREKRREGDSTTAVTGVIGIVSFAVRFTHLHIL